MKQQVSVLCVVVMVMAAAVAAGDVNEGLWEAALAGDLGGVDRALGEGGDPNWGRQKGFGNRRTAVHIAAQTSSGNGSAVLERLLAQGGRVNGKADDGRTPLHYASQYGPLPSVVTLIQHGASVNAVDKYDRTPLLKASVEGRLPVVEELLLRGAGVNITNRWGWTALHAAAAENHTSVSLALLCAGADREQRNREGETPADMARGMGHPHLADTIDTFNTTADCLTTPHTPNTTTTTASTTATPPATTTTKPPPVVSGTSGPDSCEGMTELREEVTEIREEMTMLKKVIYELKDMINTQNKLLMHTHNHAPAHTRN